MSGTTHDLTKSSYSYRPVGGGETGHLIGWRDGLQKGDFVLLRAHNNATGSAKYRLDRVDYYRDPDDMYNATVSFVPRFFDEAGNEVPAP